MVLGGGDGVRYDVAQDREGLGAEVGVDGVLAVGVDALDGGGGLDVGVRFGDGEKLREGEVVGLADEGWGHRRVEEGFEDWFSECRF